MKKSTRVNLLIALIYSIVLIGAVYIGKQFTESSEQVNIIPDESRKTEEQKAVKIARIIKNKYVDDVNTDSLMYLPIDSMLHQLDPHSAYLPPLAADELTESLNGGFEGIGVEYYILNDTLLVTRVVDGGPAARAGIRKGDKILMIDSMQVSGKNLPKSAVIGRIKGEKGTLVRVKIARQDLSNPILLNIRRAHIGISSIDAAFMLNQETGYIKIGEFKAKTDSDFLKELRVLKSKGMKKLILDLRDNGGGYLKAATALANHFFPEKKLIVYMQGKHEPRKDFFTTGGGEFENGKLTVLINENTASASEIFAGAIQDYNRGTIIGRRSFGKGLVQEQFTFDDGSAMNLTIARFYTPSGRNIQKPYDRGLRAYRNEIEERLNSGELTNKTDSIGNETTSPKGGIQPDIYVKLDTIGYNPFFTRLIQENLLINYVLEILAERYNAEYLNSTLNTFSISDKDYIDFLKYLEWQKIPIDIKQLVKTKPLIYKNLKLLLYKYHLGDEGFYKVNALSDKMIKQAVNSMSTH